jgi:hypothetical protein
LKNGGCVDINECVEGLCDALAPCTNSPGSFTCGKCPPGYSGNGLISQGGCKGGNSASDGSRNYGVSLAIVAISLMIIGM